jgi:hypothetical protein
MLLLVIRVKELVLGEATKAQSLWVRGTEWGFGVSGFALGGTNLLPVVCDGDHLTLEFHSLLLR